MLSEEACQAKECQQLVCGLGLQPVDYCRNFVWVRCDTSCRNCDPTEDHNRLEQLALSWRSDSPLSWHFLKNFCIFTSFVVKSSSAMPMSSIQITNSSLIMSSNAVAIILKNVVGALVSPNGILRYTKYPRPST